MADRADRPSWRRLGAWTAAYTAAAVLMCAPFLPLHRLGGTPAWGDARLIAWTLAWHARWPLTGDGPLDAPMFRPEPRGLVHSEPMVGLGLAAAPVTALAGPYVAFDLLRLLIPVANALAMALLVWQVRRDGWAAATAGAVMGFSHAQLASSYMGMVHLALVAGLLLGARAVDRWWTGERRADLVAAVAWSSAQALVAWYGAVITLVVLTVQLAWLTLAERVRAAVLARRIVELSVAGAVGALVLWPLASPFLAVPAPALDELRRFSLDWRWYVTPPRDTWLGAWMSGAPGSATAWDYRGSYFVGLGTAVAAIAGVGALPRDHAGRRLLWALPLVAIGGALSLGPSADGSSWRLFDLLSGVPGVAAFRVPGRMAVLVTIGLAILAGCGVAAMNQARRPWAAALVMAMLVAESYFWYPPPDASPPLETPPLIAAVRAERPDLLVIAPLLGGSLEWPHEADYLHIVRPSWTPVVNGYGRSTSAIYDLLRARFAEGPGPALVDALRFAGVTHVLVLSRYDPVTSAAFIAAAADVPGFDLVARDGDDAFYRVRPAQ
ncbi:MAG: hypothetical protein AB7U83_24940 [Vicinamibacterales bacterium]